MPVCALGVGNCSSSSSIEVSRSCALPLLAGTGGTLFEVAEEPAAAAGVVAVVFVRCMSQRLILSTYVPKALPLATVGQMTIQSSEPLPSLCLPSSLPGTRVYSVQNSGRQRIPVGRLLRIQVPVVRKEGKQYQYHQKVQRE